MRVYIAGGMTGVKDFNYAAFHAAEEMLRQRDCEPINPARTGNDSTHRPREYYLTEAIRLLLECDAIALLPCWEDSAGARLEVAIAEELNKKVASMEWVLIAPPEQTFGQILAELDNRFGSSKSVLLSICDKGEEL